jgi:hypothetical protein
MRNLGLLLLLSFATIVTADTWTVSDFQPEVPAGGRAVAVAVNPVDPRIAFVASESGGLFVTRDGGARWSHVSLVRPNRMIDVAFAPGRGDIVIATGFLDMSTVNPVGVWRSNDGGMNWTQPIAAGGCLSGGNGNAFGISFERGTNNVHVGTNCGLASSTNLGESWTLRPGPAGDPQLLSVKAAGGVVHACTWWGLYRTAPGGWVGPAAGVGGCGFTTQALDTSPADPNVVFFVNSARRIFESDDGGVTWNAVSGNGANVRPGWVRAGQMRPDGFEVHRSDGTTTFRQLCRASGPGTRCGGEWTRVEVRADSNHMAYHPDTACAQYIVSDGGIHRNAPRTSASEPCPSRYTDVGAGRGGYQALQVYEVASQRQASGWTDDLYFGTQDNNLWASTDGGRTWPGVVTAEGFALAVAPHAANPLADTVVGIACAGCVNFRTRRGFASYEQVTMPPVYRWRPFGAREDSFGMVSDVVLLTPGVHAVISQTGERDLRVYTSRNGGRDWTDAGRLPFVELRGIPVVSGPLSNRTLSIGYKRPRSASGVEDRVGIARIDNILTGRASWMGYEGGLALPESIGGYCMGAGTFRCPNVYAVNPRNPNHILMVNAETGGVWMTRDGYRWAAVDGLNRAMQGFGPAASVLQYAGAALQPHAIAFHPSNPEIFVGTESAGVFFSEDDGATWRSVPDSQRIRAITGFAFGFDGERDREVVYVSSYGRGLWKLRRVNEPRRGGGGGGGGGLPRWVPNPETLFDPWTNYQVIDPRTGGPLRFPIGPDDCPICVLALTESGRLRDLTLSSDSRVKSFATDGKFVAFQTNGKPVQVDFAITSAQQEGAFENCPTCSALVQEGATLGGAVLEDGKVIGLLALFPGDEKIPPPQPLNLTSDQQPQQTPGSWPSGPYIVLAGSLGGASQPTAIPGEPVLVIGSGFCGKPECGPVTVDVAGQIVPSDIKVREDGTFQGSFTITTPPAFEQPFRVTIRQRGEGQMVFSDSSSLVLARREAEEEDVPSAPPQQGFKVVSAKLSADPTDYSGPCPVTIRFNGEITTEGGGGEIAYTFVRSDGATGPVQKVFAQGTMKVSTTWTLSASPFEGWQAIRLLSPQELQSGEAVFRIRCE